MLLKKIVILFFLFLISLPIREQSIYVPKEEVEFQAGRILFYMDIKKQEFNEELLKKCMFYERIKYPEIVLLQAQLETGFYTSDIFLNGHNCFGMKFPKYRPTVSIGEYQGHAKYNYWWESVQDYKIWQNWFLLLGYKIGIEEDKEFYLVFLKCVQYAEDPYYIHKLVHLSQKDLT